MPATADDAAYQDRILEGVSRTFALTIPQLPAGLREAVGNAYLLCRIADTIEDDAGLAPARKRAHSERFIEVVEGRRAAAPFAAELEAELSPATPPAERDLVRNVPRVIRLTHGFNAARREAMSRCVRIMARGMAEFQETGSPAGLPDMAAMDRYCYYVAGVVGEMLTELFCDFSPAVAARRERLLPLAVSFGQGLQMTNILKDVWEDRRRGACWLPRDVFAAHGCDLASVSPGAGDPGFRRGLGELIAVAKGHLEDALAYTLLLPVEHTGIRRFCLWALGMAVLTLRKIDARRDYANGREVKISRRSVRATVLATSLAVRHDRVLRAMFSVAARGLPDGAPRVRLAAAASSTDPRP